MALIGIEGLEQRVESANLVTQLKTIADENGITNIELGPVTITLCEPRWSKRNLETGSKAWTRGAIWYIHPKTNRRVNVMIEGYVCEMSDGTQAVSLVKALYEKFLVPERFVKLDALLHEALLKLFPVLFKEYEAEVTAPKVNDKTGQSTSRVLLTPHFSHRVMGKQSCSEFDWSDWAKEKMAQGYNLHRWHSRCKRYNEEHAKEVNIPYQRVFVKGKAEVLVNA